MNFDGKNCCAPSVSPFLSLSLQLIIFFPFDIWVARFHFNRSIIINLPNQFELAHFQKMRKRKTAAHHVVIEMPIERSIVIGSLTAISTITIT